MRRKQHKKWHPRCSHAGTPHSASVLNVQAVQKGLAILGQPWWNLGAR